MEQSYSSNIYKYERIIRDELSEGYPVELRGESQNSSLKKIVIITPTTWDEEGDMQYRIETCKEGQPISEKITTDLDGELLKYYGWGYNYIF